MPGSWQPDPGHWELLGWRQILAERPVKWILLVSRSQLGAPGAVWKWPLVPDNNSAAAFPWVLSCLGANAMGRWHWMAPGVVTGWVLVFLQSCCCGAPKCKCCQDYKEAWGGEQILPGAGMLSLPGDEDGG